MDFWSWFPFSLISVFCLGASVALYRIPSVKGHSQIANTFWLLVGSGILSFVFFFGRLSDFSSQAMIFGGIWGISFAVLTMLQMYALNHVDTNTLFPVSTTASLTITVLSGILIFSESLSFWQGLGVLLAIFSVYSFLYKKGKFQFVSAVIFLLPSIVFISAFSKIIQKLAVDSVNIYSFQVFEYAFGILAAFLIFIFWDRKEFKKELFSGALPWGLLSGVFGFFGGWALIIALTKGPFTLITSVHSMYIFVTASIGYLFFKEDLNRKKLILIIVSVIAVILMRFH